MATDWKMGSNFIIFCPDPDKLISNEVDLNTDDGFRLINKSTVSYPVREDVTVELTDTEIINSLDVCFAKKPEIIKVLNRNVQEGLSILQDCLCKEFDVSVDMDIVYNEMPKVRDFIDLVSLGVVVGLGYENVLSYPYRLFFKSARIGDCPYCRKTNIGMCFKTLPIINDIVASEINTVTGAFYKQFLSKSAKKTDGDYFRYFLSTLPDQEATRKINDIVDLKEKDNKELAGILADNSFSPKVVRDLQSQIKDRKRLNIVFALAKLIK